MVMRRYVTLILLFVAILESKDTEENTNSKQEQVVVRAVFINCVLVEEQNYNEAASTRFQREELYKHSALEGCRKKLALTVKIASETENSSGDEYIPIEHVFDGSSSKRRVRLLDPYILRLRRDSPLQAYKLRRIDTVTAIITQSDDRRSNTAKKSRVQRNSNELSHQRDCRDAQRLKSSFSATDDLGVAVSTNISDANLSLKVNESALFHIYKLDNESEISQNRDGQENSIKRDTCTIRNNPAWKRDKRHEHNIIVEDVTDDYNIPWTIKNRFYRTLDRPTISKEYDKTDKSKETYGKIIRQDKVLQMSPKSKIHLQKKSRFQSELRRLPFEGGQINQDHKELLDVTKDDKRTDQSAAHDKLSSPKRIIKKYKDNPENFDKAGKNFVLYDIGSPDLWYTVHVQLFEKMSTSEGKTVWNDMTKGEVARVSTLHPEWTDQDMNVRYKPTEWMPKEEFILPSAVNLCLLAPIHDASKNFDSEIGKYIIVPRDDIVSLENTEDVLNKRDGNYSDISAPENQGRHRVMIRVSRALLTENYEELKVSLEGSDRFLTMPHRRPHHAQIDVEARADGNQIICVGSSGSLITIVSDNSRRTRSVLTVQATNKGLAAARFRVKVRDCGPEMESVISVKGDDIMAGPILVPPRHTQRFQLELPTGLPTDTIHCSVALINDDEESVAVRDVAIRKSDRCFCVWHCDCVCINVDPKLSCREMPEARQTAAGLAPRTRGRRARSVCYHDCITINIFVVVLGVLMTLLLLGVIKACFGLYCRCVATWGLELVMQTPRKLERYFEPALQGRCVVYDDQGWPVHPDTKKRNVRLVSKSMEFILNVIIFIILPCVLIRDAVVQLACRSKLRHCDPTVLGREDRKCFSTHDMQGLQPRLRRRRGGLRRWMTPQAEELSTNIWSKGLTARQSVECGFMRPLLHECKRNALARELPSSCADSEQDDTEYVLTQMHKSKESLARSQKKNEPAISSTRN